MVITGRGLILSKLRMSDKAAYCARKRAIYGYALVLHYILRYMFFIPIGDLGEFWLISQNEACTMFVKSGQQNKAICSLFVY